MNISKNRIFLLMYKMLNSKKLSGYERATILGKQNKPLIWEFGHRSFFYQHLLKYIDEENTNNISDRYKIHLLLIVKKGLHIEIIQKIKKFFDITFNDLEKWLENNKLDNITTYLFLLSIFH